MAQKLARFAVCISAVAALAGCGTGMFNQDGAGISAPAPGASTLVTRFGREDRAPISKSEQRSWMAPNAKKQDLMYISDALTSNVYVYSYPAGKLVGTLTGFSQPQGMCVDAKGNVWITNTLAYQILKFPHGGTSPIATLTQTEQTYIGCSVDPSTGTLAVTSFCQFVRNVCISPGSVFIYKNTKTGPTQYAMLDAANVYFCGYDPHGNLFVDANANVSVIKPFLLGELTAGGSAIQPVYLDRPIYFPGAVQWGGKYLAVGDQNAGNQFTSAVHQVKVKGGNGTVVGTTILSGTADAAQTWIQGSTIVVPNVALGAPSDARLYNYPGGGEPSMVWGSGTFNTPLGATVSLTAHPRHKN
jgi:hypothetical protein